jgi:hypothetical protein
LAEVVVEAARRMLHLWVPVEAQSLQARVMPEELK